MAKPEVYLDMDGVIADFFTEYAKLAGVTSGKYRDIPPAKVDPTLDKMIGTDFFARLPKFPTADKLVGMIVKTFGGYKICSSPLRGDHQNSEHWKRVWIEKHLSPQPNEIIITPNKAKYAKQKDGTPNILIDDRGSNISSWEAAGGIGIKYQADEDSLQVVLDGFKRAFEVIRGEKEHEPQQLKSLDRGKMIQVAKSGDSDEEPPSSAADLKEDQDDYEISNYKKLDYILYKLSELVVKGQKTNPEKFGMVAAAVLDVDNNLVASTSTSKGDKWIHAERNAIDRYISEYGEIPEGSIIVTTCSPCSETMSDRYKESCTDFINQQGIKKVYAGYMDPTQDEEQREFNIIETSNSSIRDICEQFAQVFLDYEASEQLKESWSNKYKKSINCNNPKGFSQRAHCQGRKKKNENIEEERKKKRKPKSAAYGPGPYGWYGYDAGYSGGSSVDGGVGENFADGRNPGDKGSLKAKVKGKVTLKKANRLMHKKGATARDKQLAHWFINMQKGRKK